MEITDIKSKNNAIDQVVIQNTVGSSFSHFKPLLSEVYWDKERVTVIVYYKRDDGLFEGFFIRSDGDMSIRSYHENLENVQKSLRHYALEPLT